MPTKKEYLQAKKNENHYLIMFICYQVDLKKTNAISSITFEQFCEAYSHFLKISSERLNMSPEYLFQISYDKVITQLDKHFDVTTLTLTKKVLVDETITIIF
jgi:hypothetical protein